MNPENNDADPQARIETPVSRVQSAKSAALRVLKFVKKHWKIFTGLVVIIVLAVALYFFIPVVSIDKTRLVNTDTTVRLEQGQVVKLKIGDVSVKIAHFTNETCPKRQTCFGNAKGAEYMLTVDGQQYATGSLNTENASDYRIKTESSDYKTYADLRISKIKK